MPLMSPMSLELKYLQRVYSKNRFARRVLECYMGCGARLKTDIQYTQMHWSCVQKQFKTVLFNKDIFVQSFLMPPNVNDVFN